MLMQFVYFALVLCVSIGLTGLLRFYALKNNVVDVPNARSSHIVPTPRGGGVAIVLVFLAILAFYHFWMLFLAGLMVALVGWFDDHGHVRSGFRLSIHIAGSTLVLFSVGGMPSFTMFGFVQDWGIFGDLMAVLAIGWILNLFNFMDGIDGIAGVELVTASVVSALLLYFMVGLNDVVSLHLFLAVAALGFLVWNFPPAKIFMGDAGSGFLGLMLGALALYSTHIAPQMLWAWLILLGVFIVDATYTLIRRLLRGDKVYEAHRSHAYQYAYRKYGRHLPVTLAVLVINLCWLAPWSAAVAFGVVDGAVGVLCAYAPLLWLAWYFHAGEVEPNA